MAGSNAAGGELRPACRALESSSIRWFNHQKDDPYSDRRTASKKRYGYKLLATSRTSTMQKELQEAGDAGFVFVGMTISHTAFGGKEVVSILRKEVAE